MDALNAMIDCFIVLSMLLKANHLMDAKIQKEKEKWHFDPKNSRDCSLSFQKP